MNYLDLVISLLKGTPLAPFAVKLEADVAAGKINLAQVPGLIETVGPAALQFFPKDAPEINLVLDVTAAVDKYMALKAQTPASTASVVVPPKAVGA